MVRFVLGYVNMNVSCTPRENVPSFTRACQIVDIWLLECLLEVSNHHDSLSSFQIRTVLLKCHVVTHL
jgi:hypothetical protein